MGRTSSGKQRLLEAAFALIWEQSFGSVTIDAICERAQVKKGSFYYFFDSKSALMMEAIKDKWIGRRKVFTKIFARERPPLTRMLDYFDEVIQHQLEFYREKGFILGCPYYRLGSEISQQEDGIRKLIQDFYDEFQNHFVIAIEDAQNRGEIPPGNAQAKAKMILGYWQGTLSRARIENNPLLLQEFGLIALEILQAKRLLMLEMPRIEPEYAFAGA